MEWKVSGVLGFKGPIFFTNRFRYERTIFVKWLAREGINLNTDVLEFKYNEDIKAFFALCQKKLPHFNLHLSGPNWNVHHQTSDRN